MLSALRPILATERRKTTLVVLFWSLGIASTFAQALIQRAYLTTVDYASAFAICLLAGVIMIDIGRAIVSFAAAMFLGMIFLVAMLTVPASLGALPPPGDILIASIWITIVFYAIFPFPLLAFLLATIIGSVIGERYF